MLELLIIGGFLLFGGLYSEGLKCAGAYSVWNFVRGGAYFRNFLLHEHELPQLDLAEASRGLAVNIQLMLPQTPIL